MSPKFAVCCGSGALALSAAFDKFTLLGVIIAPHLTFFGDVEQILMAQLQAKLCHLKDEENSTETCPYLRQHQSLDKGFKCLGVVFNKKLLFWCITKQQLSTTLPQEVSRTMC